MLWWLVPSAMAPPTTAATASPAITMVLVFDPLLALPEASPESERPAAGLTTGVASAEPAVSESAATAAINLAIGITDLSLLGIAVIHTGNGLTLEQILAINSMI